MVYVRFCTETARDTGDFTDLYLFIIRRTIENRIAVIVLSLQQRRVLLIFVYTNNNNNLKGFKRYKREKNYVLCSCTQFYIKPL